MNETIIAKANGLTLRRIATHVEPQQPPLSIAQNEMQQTVAAYIGNTSSFFVAYLDYKVIIGKYVNGEFQNYEQDAIDPKYVQRLRVFNHNKEQDTGEELLLWRSGQMLKGRYRKDGEGDETEVVEAYQVLFGAKKGKHSNETFTEITEDRGTSLILPFAGFALNDATQRIFLKTHNYIDYNAVHQATYVDCRFVGFAKKEGDDYRNLL